MEKRIEQYEDREQLEREVEQLSDEGWVLDRISRLSEERVEAEFTRRSSMISDRLSEQPQTTT